MAGWFSRLGPKHETDGEEEEFFGEEEWLVQYAKDKLASENIDYFIFGHRHLPIEYALPKGALYINLGDWIRYNTYAVFDGAELKLQTFTD